jgi:hypothetical protein
MFNWAKRALTLGLFCFGCVAAASAQTNVGNVVVYVTGSDPNTLNLVRQVVSNPIFGKVDGRSSIIAGTFDQAGADLVTRELQNRGLGAQQTLYRTPVQNAAAIPQYQYISAKTIPYAPNTQFQPQPTSITPTNSISTIPVSGTATGGFNLAENRYVTGIPLRSEGLDELFRVRRFIPTAFIANSDRGRYIYAGGYPKRDNAESLKYFLRARGFEARVLYF